MACDKGDYETIFFSSVHAQQELSQILALVEEGITYSNLNTYKEYRKTYNHFELPDLVDVIDKNNLNLLKKAVIELDNKLKKILIEHGVKLNIFKNADEFSLFIQNS